jgi:peptidoglycan/xylan/chitin deacetylase (PgdA/CDA1 family)
VAWLSARCTVLPLGEALARNAGDGPRDRPLVAITFDDGYADNWAIAARVLEESGVRGTFFVTTGFVESGEPLWFDRAARLWERSTPDMRDLALRASGAPPAGDPAAANLRGWMAFLKLRTPGPRAALLDALEERAGKPEGPGEFEPMTPEQVGDLARRGHEVGSHAVTHPILPQLEDGELATELSRSRDVLREWTGAEVPGFCYPNGDHDDRVVGAVSAAGYRWACTTKTGIQLPAGDVLRVPRVDVSPERVQDHARRYDPVAFRAEISAFRELLR